MESLRTFIDGRRFLTDSPFRSGYFLTASLVGLGAVITAGFVTFRHWQKLNAGAIEIITIVIGLQLIYQWVRILRYYSKIRNLYAMKPEWEAKEGTPVDIALRIATGGLIEILFYCYGMTFVALFLIGAILTHFGRIK